MSVQVHHYKLLETCGFFRPIEAEANHYRLLGNLTAMAAGPKATCLHDSRSGSVWEIEFKQLDFW